MDILKDMQLLSYLDRTYQMTNWAMEAHMAHDEARVRELLPGIRSICGKLSGRIYEIDCKENYKEDDYF